MSKTNIEQSLEFIFQTFGHESRIRLIIQILPKGQKMPMTPKNPKF